MKRSTIIAISFAVGGVVFASQTTGSGADGPSGPKSPPITWHDIGLINTGTGLAPRPMPPRPAFVPPGVPPIYIGDDYFRYGNGSTSRRLLNPSPSGDSLSSQRSLDPILGTDHILDVASRSGISVSLTHKAAHEFHILTKVEGQQWQDSGKPIDGYPDGLGYAAVSPTGDLVVASGWAHGGSAYGRFSIRSGGSNEFIDVDSPTFGRPVWDGKDLVMLSDLETREMYRFDGKSWEAIVPPKPAEITSSWQQVNRLLSLDEGQPDGKLLFEVIYQQLEAPHEFRCSLQTIRLGMFEAVPGACLNAEPADHPTDRFTIFKGTVYQLSRADSTIQNLSSKESGPTPIDLKNPYVEVLDFRATASGRLWLATRAQSCSNKVCVRASFSGFLSAPNSLKGWNQLENK